MLSEIITLIIGVIAILVLAEIAVRNSIRLAHHFKWSGTFIGLTILSIGTSIPEIMSAIVGSIDIIKQPSLMNTISGLIIGTNVGSDIFQQSFILAVIGLIGTIVVIRKNILSEVGALIAGATFMWIMTIGGTINRFEGFLMFAAYVGYLFYLKKRQKKKKHEDLNIKHVVHAKARKRKLPNWRIMFEVATIAVAFTIMAFAANTVIKTSTKLVAELPISASFFGVLLLGIASALPELTTALVAVFKNKKGISAGVLIGSNVTNPLMGLGLGAMISGYAIPRVTMLYDLPFKIGIACLIFWFLWRNEKLNKWESITLIAIFIAYLVLRNFLFPVDF
ncbi:sodium:calcium antiporter [Candidatus Woesearchaeota archaeon]|jgi:cation:H+ antiporter|nr:sodium:calcium antiporter [Candidatus Woesearchaeota archaeon]MBT4110234.1 sodium:calcium antiporter [Candidatus Woesearchaeota archaeon]MBT4336242.1 sodium:calcium antiporter [Candidatus Woesearchaeota archaeon]MBT4468779.1 sodium:calcium antiporter [Candidatus Woesearchaeota archaeon]MBT6744902.1 sodium:calcium antiporter [Candidatus Woesearchaeota archaeon]